MDWLRALLGIFIIIAIAFLLGWTHAKVKRATAYASIWIGSILLLLVIRFGVGKTWETFLLLLAVVSYSLEHIPGYIGQWVFWMIVLGFAEYRFRVTAAAVLEVLAEVEKTNARLSLLESSLRAKLHDD